MTNLDRITTVPARMNGEPRIRNMRLTVRRVLEALATYPERAELKSEYPELEDEDIRQALAFVATSLDDKILPRSLPADAASRPGPAALLHTSLARRGPESLPHLKSQTRPLQSQPGLLVLAARSCS